MNIFRKIDNMNVKLFNNPLCLFFRDIIGNEKILIAILYFLKKRSIAPITIDIFFRPLFLYPIHNPGL